jgi:hypothetical protein
MEGNMATWTFEEDFIVCDFYLRHINDWPQNLDELMRRLAERGFNRDKNSAKMRVQNFEYLQTAGKSGLKNGAKQSNRIYEVFNNHISNATLVANIKAHIQGTYIGENKATATESFSEEQMLAPLSLSFLTEAQQNLHNLVFTLPKEPTFKDILFGFIEKKGFKKHSDVYNAAQIKRDTFNAIKKGKNYGVSRRTVMQFCFGLKLSYDEAVVLMASAGYAFSHSNLTDVIVEYYLKKEIHDIFEVNISLYDSGADLLFQ